MVLLAETCEAIACHVDEKVGSLNSRQGVFALLVGIGHAVEGIAAMIELGSNAEFERAERSQ